jgi:Ca2+-transporting ATPase
MVFCSLAFAQVGQALASRSRRESLFALGLGSNPLLLGMAALVTLLQLAVIYIPPVAAFFYVMPLSLPDLLIALGAGVLVLTVMEGAKLRKWTRATYGPGARESSAVGDGECR